MTPLRELLAQITAAQPHLYVTAGQIRSDPAANPETWPLYTYGHSEEAASVWKAMATHLGVRFIADLRDLRHVWADLNESRSAALSSGVIWIQTWRRGTTQQQNIGVTFHPAQAGRHVYLTTPRIWHDLLSVTFPETSNEYLDAQYAVTYTVASDNADYVQMTPVMRSLVRRHERGIETGVPTMPVSPEAFSQFTPTYMQQYHLIPYRLDRTAGILHAYVSDLDDTTLADRVTRATGLTLQVTYMEPADEAAFWAQYALGIRAQEETEQAVMLSQ